MTNKCKQKYRKTVRYSQRFGSLQMNICRSFSASSSTSIEHYKSKCKHDIAGHNTEIIYLPETATNNIFVQF